MSDPTQNKSSNQNELPHKPPSMARDAQELMENIFSDIDRVLEGKNSRPLHRLSMTVKEEKGIKSDKIRWHRFPRYFDQILFLVACTSLVAAIFLFLHQDKLKSQFDGTTADNQTEAANAQFIAYMLRSLKEIEGQELAREENATTVNPLSPVNSPTPEPIPVQTPQVITRTTYIPIPVYPQTPTETVTPTETETETPTPTETETPTPTETETPTPTETETETPTPSLESEPTPPLSPEPNHNHTLVGLLELGDRSVALFDINGNIERIHLGEEIGASGWILDSVADREVKIRGYDTQRSIYVGQKF